MAHLDTIGKRAKVGSMSERRLTLSFDTAAERQALLDCMRKECPEFETKELATYAAVLLNQYVAKYQRAEAAGELETDRMGRQTIVRKKT